MQVEDPIAVVVALAVVTVAPVVIVVLLHYKIYWIFVNPSIFLLVVILLESSVIQNILVGTDFVNTLATTFSQALSQTFQKGKGTGQNQDKGSGKGKSGEQKDYSKKRLDMWRVTSYEVMEERALPKRCGRSQRHCCTK